MGENICKQSHQQGINLQSIQTTHVAQYQKTNIPNKKWVEDLNKYFPKENMWIAKNHIKIQ